jgi:hypothetical protein
VLVVVIAAVALVSGGGEDSTPSGTGAGQTTSTPARQVGSAPPHEQVTVTVLNGTNTSGLANTVANELTDDGFVRGEVTNASSPDRLVTVVSYFGGQEEAALEVARSLGVSFDVVQPIDPDTETAACPGGSATCQATVVVTVGADRQ